MHKLAIAHGFRRDALITHPLEAFADAAGLGDSACVSLDLLYTASIFSDPLYVEAPPANHLMTDEWESDSEGSTAASHISDLDDLEIGFVQTIIDVDAYRAEMEVSRSTEDHTPSTS